MKYPLGELFDRYTIELRKNTYGADNSQVLGKIEDSLGAQFGTRTFLLLRGMALVALANADIANLEWQVREGRQLSLEELGRRALKIREINERRVAAKNELARLVDEPPEARVHGYGPDLCAEDLTLGVQETSGK